MVLYKRIKSNDIDLLLYEIINKSQIAKTIYFSNYKYFYNLIRKRNVKIIKLMWKKYSNEITKLRNNDNEDVLNYTRKLRGLTQNIIKLFETKCSSIPLTINSKHVAYTLLNNTIKPGIKAAM